VVSYGQGDPGPARLADFHVRRQGSKFQNLHWCYRHWAKALHRYDAVFVPDDDIVIDAPRITRLFDILRERQLWILQPAFRPVGKISWDITRARAGTLLRYTNYVEMACPLFLRGKLDAFMDVYDPELISFGTDWWFLQVIGGGPEHRVAIVDEVPVVNPHDRTKGGRREIDRAAPVQDRLDAWDRIRRRIGIVDARPAQREYGHVARPLAGCLGPVARHAVDALYSAGRRAPARCAAA
jgi:hypothetical protein